MTIAKSKYYMLKVNFAPVFEKVEFDSQQGRQDILDLPSTEDRFAETTQDKMNKPEMSEAQKKRADLLSNLRKPVKNLDEEFEDLDTPEQIEKRKKILEKIQQNMAAVDDYSESLNEGLKVT
mmetsp:Transcript_13195/g.20559  ORF Transcript_13195/g.20559 Transcript_13195/m.20559 type:complete len:122 (+) Transcript_13195:419-784(+)